MEWKKVPLENKWVLTDNGDTAAMIIAVDKEGITNRFQVKSLVSAIYLGKKRFAGLEKKKQDWFTTRRKFPTEEERSRYITAKMKSIFHHIAVQSR